MELFQNLEQYGDLLEKIDAWEWGQAKKLAFWFARYLCPDEVIDIGCASGLYLKPYERIKPMARLIGIDGAPTAGTKLKPGQYVRWDLRHLWPTTRKFDLCYCLETAEHIEPQYVDIFIRSVAESAYTILFSAAAPGQGGVGHYNLQPKSYWLDKFAAYKIGLHPLNESFQAYIQTNPQQCFHPWLINNSMILGYA